MRTALLIAATTSLFFAALAGAHPAGPNSWKRYVIEKYTYSDATTAPLEFSLATGDVLEWPVETHNFIFPPGTTKFENRLLLTVTGVPAGHRIALRADRDCSNDGDLDASTTSSTTNSYALTVRAGHSVLLPAAVQALHNGVSCSWVLDFAIAGARHATVTLTAFGFKTPGYVPMVFATPQANDDYAREICQVTVASGSDQRSCTPIRG